MLEDEQQNRFLATKLAEGKKVHPFLVPKQLQQHSVSQQQISTKEIVNMGGEWILPEFPLSMFAMQLSSKEGVISSVETCSDDLRKAVFQLDAVNKRKEVKNLRWNDTLLECCSRDDLQMLQNQQNSQQQPANQAPLSEEEKNIKIEELATKYKKQKSQLLALFKSLVERRANKKFEGSLWTEKYSPMKLNQIVGNSEATNMVQKWLRDWFVFRRNLSNQKQQKTKQFNDASEEEDDDDDNEDEEFETPKSKRKQKQRILNMQPKGLEEYNAILFRGGYGIGKSCTVYALAQEFNIRVIEINPSNERSSKQLQELFAEATQSHQLQQQQQENNHKNISSFNEVSYDRSIIFFDEVDNIFEKDIGFIGALKHLIEMTKQPIVLACNGLVF